mmetsp:Transcript_47891/g.110185  ORF Transcript_47891/g.110185 Transcript_47891/m.110185 type:complete len:209 (+) Transcript_47891:307-933(+)
MVSCALKRSLEQSISQRLGPMETYPGTDRTRLEPTACSPPSPPATPLLSLPPSLPPSPPPKRAQTRGGAREEPEVTGTPPFFFFFFFLVVGSSFLPHYGDSAKERSPEGTEAGDHGELARGGGRTIGTTRCSISSCSSPSLIAFAFAGPQCACVAMNSMRSRKLMTRARRRRMFCSALAPSKNLRERERAPGNIVGTSETPTCVVPWT